MKSNASIGEFSNVAVCEPEQNSSAIDPSLEKMRALYRTDQQVKLLDLQAEADSLLQRLQALKQQRLSTGQESR